MKKLTSDIYLRDCGTKAINKVMITDTKCEWHVCEISECPYTGGISLEWIETFDLLRDAKQYVKGLV